MIVVVSRGLSLFTEIGGDSVHPCIDGIAPLEDRSQGGRHNRGHPKVQSVASNLGSGPSSGMRCAYISGACDSTTRKLAYQLVVTPTSVCTHGQKRTMHFSVRDRKMQS